MFRTVDSLEELTAQLPPDFTTPLILIPVLRDARRHPEANALSVLGVCSLDAIWLVPLHHSEMVTSISVPESIWQGRWIGTPDRKLLHTIYPTLNVHDLQAIEYLKTGSVTDLSKFYHPTVRHFHDLYYKHDNINEIIPLSIWYEVVKEYALELGFPLMHTGLLPGYDMLRQELDVLGTIERSGLQVREVEQRFPNLEKRFYETGKLYTQYSIYTSTGRPSNRFGGINFAALPHEGPERDAIGSRFENGTLIALDYEAYHVRLIAEELKYSLPPSSLHRWFGQHYFQTDQLTPEQYDESKKKTFVALYGEGGEAPHPFFAKVRQYQGQLWTYVNKVQKLRSSISGRSIDLANIWDPNPAKVFNYLVQMLEIENSTQALTEVLRVLEGAQTMPILYTYDAVLFDWHPDEAHLLPEVIRCMTMDGRYPVHVSKGPTYGQLKKLTV